MTWIDEVKAVQKEQNITYKEAMKLASSRRKPGLVGGSIFIRRDYPPSVREFIKKNGEKEITGIIIQRVPLASTLNGFLNVLTLGQYNKAKKKAGYDDLFHLSMIATIGGKRVVIEKNEVINISNKIPSMKQGGEQLTMNNFQPIKLNTLLNNAYEKRGDQMFVYSADKNNCQDFLVLLLKSSNLLTPEAEQFIKQDAQAIFKRMPDYTASLAKSLTDMAAFGNLVLEGRGAK